MFTTNKHALFNQGSGRSLSREWPFLIVRRFTTAHSITDADFDYCDLGPGRSAVRRIDYLLVARKKPFLEKTRFVHRIRPPLTSSAIRPNCLGTSVCSTPSLFGSAMILITVGSSLAATDILSDLTFHNGIPMLVGAGELLFWVRLGQKARGFSRLPPPKVPYPGIRDRQAQLPQAAFYTSGTLA